MLADSTRANNPLLFSIAFTTRCSGRSFWIDDLKITETTPSDEEPLFVVGAKGKTISNKVLADSSVLAVGAQSGASPVYKTYLNFGENKFSNVQRAILKLNVASSTPHGLNVYAIPSANYEGSITFNNAPENGAGTSMNVDALAKVNVTDSGSYEIDVTDYIKANRSSDSIFAITTDALLGREYYNQDFESFSFTEDLDYEPYGNSASFAGINNGECSIIEGIRLLNTFGNNQECESNTKYKLTADVTVCGSEESYNVLLGAAKADTAPEYTKEVALPSNTKTTVTFEFTTGDADKLTNIVIADISDIISGSIKIDNVILSSDKTQITDAVLSVASASEANVSYTVGKFIYSDNGNIQDSLSSATDAVKVNVYNGNMADFSPILVVAVYKENKLVDLYISEKQTIAENASQNLECNGINLENKDYDDVKVFIWNEMEPI